MRLKNSVPAFLKASPRVPVHAFSAPGSLVVPLEGGSPHGPGRHRRRARWLLGAAGVALATATLPTGGAAADTVPRHSGVLRGGTTNLSNTNAYPNTPIIPGPVKIPAGGVAIPAGANIQAAIDSHAAGTQFNLAAGTYQGAGILRPKAGDRFYGVKAGPGGTLLSGLAIQRPDSGATNVEIHNISITGYSDGARNGAIDSDFHEVNAASGWKITNSEIYGNYLGASLGPNSLVENNTFHDNSCKGAAGGMTGTVWRYNQFIHNNLPGVNDPGGDCAGVKVTVETNNQFIGNLISDSGHPAGGWMDVSCHGNTFTDNISYNNNGSGFTDETGYNNTFTNNIAAGNGRNTPDPWRRTGIVFQSSANDSAKGNFTWRNNGPGITIFEEDRHDAPGQARNQNNTVQGNYLDVAPAVIKVNIDAPQHVGPNTLSRGNGIPVPQIVAGPQM